MLIDEWNSTKIDSVHPEIEKAANLNALELPIVSCYMGDSSWYTLTTERVIGTYLNDQIDENIQNIINKDFGHFKGNSDRKREIVLLQSGDGKNFRLEYETGNASMAPIYYFRFWEIKFPIIEKLKG